MNPLRAVFFLPFGPLRSVQTQSFCFSRSTETLGSPRSTKAWSAGYADRGAGREKRSPVGWRRAHEARVRASGAFNHHHVGGARNEDAPGVGFDGNVVRASVTLSVMLFNFERLRVPIRGAARLLAIRITRAVSKRLVIRPPLRLRGYRLRFYSGIPLGLPAWSRRSASLCRRAFGMGAQEVGLNPEGGQRKQIPRGLTHISCNSSAPPRRHSNLISSLDGQKSLGRVTEGKIEKEFGLAPFSVPPTCWGDPVRPSFNITCPFCMKPDE